TNRSFGTLDYNESPPLVFLGTEVTLAELGITTTRTPEREERRVGAAQLGCPNCGGPLELRAPDKTERVTCPNCNSLLDVNQGQLKFLKSLEPPSFQPVIPLGSTGDVPEGKMTVIGAMQRSVTIDGVTYFWSEYLLYNPQIGFRWLVNSDDHWNYVRAVPPGEVSESGKYANYSGKNYKIFQDAQARVEYVFGEFYWKVEVGEQVRGVDYVAAPYMLSKEVSTIYITDPENPQKHQRAAGEINWSLGTYVTVPQIETAFGVKDLPRPSNIAPNQPYKHKWVYKYWILFIVILLAVGFGTMVLSGSTKEVFAQRITLPPLANADGTQVFFSQPFELAGRRNIRIVGESPVQNTWVYLEGDLINEETGVVESFPIEISYYQGVEDGESWSEGGQTDSAFTSAMPAGRYVLRLEGQWERWQGPATIQVKIEQNVTHGFNLLLALIVLSLGPIVMAFYHLSFEHRRWSESMFTPSGSADDDDDEE
ncbi:MAG TPA: DUF4178 domain-containing protein, partial [Pyrinomonadaceae bacterium]|nr:DUF4178 domain-containing protein [Pyrinomonadaceae bacterium]